MKKIFIVLFFSAQIVHAVRSSITVYPLVNQSRDVRHEWISFYIPEYFSRALGGVEGVRVWDPVFMMQTDSLGWRMTSDSLLHQHHTRWMWDAAIGGSYSVVHDSLRINLKIVWVTGTKQHLSMKITKTSGISGCFKVSNELLLNTCALLKIALSKDDSLRIGADNFIATAAGRTFCAGYGFEMKGHYSEALTSYNRAIDLDPSMEPALCRSGTIYLRTGNMRKAEQIYKTLLKHGNHHNSTIAMMTDFAVDQYSPSRSMRIIQKYRERLEKNALGLEAIGKWYMITGEYQRAIAHFRRAIAWGAANLDADFLLAMACMWSGEYASTVEIFNRLISMRPDYTRYQVSLGAVYRKAERHMESLAVLEAARKKEPENAMVLIELAHTSFALKWYRKAGQLLEQARILKPGQYEILINLGIVYWHERRFADAQRCFNLVEKEHTVKQSLMVNYGNMELMEGNISKAITAYRMAERAGHRNPEVLYNLVVACLKKGDKKASARYLDELLQLTPGRVDLLVIRAHLAQMLGKEEDAKMAYHKILENDPYNDAAVEGLVKLLISEKNYEEAIYRIEAYLEAKPARGDFMVLLGDVYRAQGWYEVAKVKYEQVIQTYPDYTGGYVGLGRCMYDMVRYKDFKQYDAVLYALKQAGSMAPANPEPYDMMGDIYMYYKGYRDLAIEHWQRALAKTSDGKQKKVIMHKINSAGKS